MKPYRKVQWIQPRLQLGIVLLVMAAACCAVIVQGAIMTYWLARFSQSLPNDGVLASQTLPSILVRSSIASVPILVPLLYVFGLAVTYRLIGPMYRFREFLESVLRGEHPEPCKLRDKDQLQDVCELLNRATESLRAGQVGPAGDDEAGRDAA
jgi:hypothetical protein